MSLSVAFINRALRTSEDGQDLEYLISEVPFLPLKEKALSAEECVELHSMLLIISPFMFWDDPKTFSESILSLLVFWLETKFQDCSCNT